MLYFFVSLTVFCIISVIYPYVIYPAILSLLPRRSLNNSVQTSSDGSKFSLLFCAYNEADAMPSKIANLRELVLRYPSLEVLAFDDGSTDGTADLIAKEAPFVELFKGGGRNGKAHGMKLLASKASGEFLVFTDANVLLDLDALDKLATCYSDPNIGGVCGALHYVGHEGSSTAAVGGMYWKIEEKIKDLESATGSVIGADGSIFSIRRELYPEFPDTVLDDFTVSMEVLFKGFRLIKSNDVVAYERLVSARSDEFSRKIRISARAFHTHIVLKSKRAEMTMFNKFKYVSHKTIRWFGGAFLIVGYLAAFTSTALIQPTAAFLLLFITIGSIILGLRCSSGVISSLTEIFLAMIATLIGLLRAIRGKTVATWNPAKSR